MEAPGKSHFTRGLKNEQEINRSWRGGGEESMKKEPRQQQAFSWYTSTPASHLCLDPLPP